KACANAERPGFASEPLDNRQLRELVPIAGDAALGSFLWHWGGHANPQRTVQAYAWALQDHGGRILQHATVTGIEVAGGRAVAVETTAGRFGCDQLVIAAGPQSGAMARLVGADLPVTPARAEIVVTEPIPLLEHGGVDGNGLYGRQTLRGNLVYGGGPHEWLPDEDGRAWPTPTTPLIANIARRLTELFPKAGHLRMIRSWAGIIENTPDGRPVIDHLDEPDNVLVATLSSIGFGLSPAVGRAISEMVLQRRCAFADLSTLKLSRFANLPADWRARQGWLPPDIE
ncbi:MAG: FAD-binding oxidoreductase, partial [Proteobacteria bacterium]|nr:FAD-binding oxidoreductase [Pseudomonadota bacterium]